MINYRSLITILSFVVCLFPLNAFSGEINNELRVNRYSLMKPVATKEQKDILSVIVKVSFNQKINTVGDAVERVLNRSGYKLAPIESSDPKINILLTRPLPLIHKELGPMTVEDALRTLAGSAWELVIDPVNRLVSFELLQKYREL